jgi:D-arabinose 1-dehydrogenase-like Zn-dependent alcohol dehydrogenase
MKGTVLWVGTIEIHGVTAKKSALLRTHFYSSHGGGRANFRNMVVFENRVPVKVPKYSLKQCTNYFNRLQK